MKDFGRWFAEQSPPMPSIDEQMEDVGCWKTGSAWMFSCRHCGGDADVPCTEQEWLDTEDYYKLCGGSPRCLP